MGFFVTIGRSIFSPPWYAAMPQRTFGSALGYFLLLSLLVTIVRTIIVSLPVLGNLPGILDQVSGSIVQTYPDELVVHIHNGVVSTNVKEPYFIPMPKFQGSSSGSVPQNLIVIDTHTAFSVEQFHAYRAVVWLGRDAIYSQSSNTGQVQANDLAQIADFTLDKALIRTGAQAVAPWLRIIGPLLVVLAFIGFFMFYLFHLLYMLIFAVVVLVVSVLVGGRLTYGQSYVVGMYAMTLGILVDIVVAATQPLTHFHGFPFMFSLITLVVVVLNLYLGRQAQGLSTAPAVGQSLD